MNSYIRYRDGIIIAKNRGKGITRILGTTGGDNVFWDKELQRYHFFIDGKRIVNTYAGDDIIGVDPDPWQTSYYGDNGPVFVNAGLGDDKISLKKRTGSSFFSKVKGGSGYDTLYVAGYSLSSWSRQKKGKYWILSDPSARTVLQVHRDVEEILPL